MTGLLDLTIKASALLIVAGLVVVAMRRASAASRHLVWMSFFCAAAFLPMGRLALPVLPVAVLEPQPPRPLMRFLAMTPSGGVGARRSIVARDQHINPIRPVQRSVWTKDQLVNGVWFLGLGLCLARMLNGAIGLRHLGRQARPLVDPDVLARVERARQALGVRREVRVLTLDGGVMPVTWGSRYPTIILPTASARWLVDRRHNFDAVIVHEVAHIARFDAVAQLVTQLVTAVFWFHPGFWIAQRQARLERERSCDDVALVQGSRPADYALELLTLVRSLRFLANAPGALGVGRRSQLDRRIGDILNNRINRRGRSWLSVLTAGMLFLATGPIAAMHLTPRTVRSAARLGEAYDLSIRTPSSPAGVRRAEPSRNFRVLGGPRSTPPSASTPRIGGTFVGATTPKQITSGTAADARWRDDRGQMFQKLIDEAEALVEDCQTQIRIGTMAQIDTAGPLQTLATLTARAKADRASSASAPPVEEQMAVRLRFTSALEALEPDKIRFSVGLSTAAQIDDDLLAAADVLRQSPRPSGTTEAIAVSTAGFSAALEKARSLGTVEARADALLALARLTVFTPAMVEQYVEAVSGLSSATERARVFAQPIRVQPPGRN